MEDRKERVARFCEETLRRPVKFRELAGLLMVPKEERDELHMVLQELLTEGRLTMDENGRYLSAVLAEPDGIFCGTGYGYGFVHIDGETEDVFIPQPYTQGALNGDRVRIRITEQERGGHRRAGCVLAIVRRAAGEVVGTFFPSGTLTSRKNGGKGAANGFVVSDNPRYGSDIYIRAEDTMGAAEGHKVAVEVLRYGDGVKKPEGRIVEILGHRNDPGVDVESVIRALALPVAFPQEVYEQIKELPYALSPQDYEGRLDLRDAQIVTIDGADAKDLDDAISLTFADGVYQLGVHIADVSHYVPEGSPLDEEALRRGTSVYLTDRVIPMLPHRLSNGLCSLNPNEDRLALSCLMELDEAGNLLRHTIAETVICSSRRMTYSDVARLLVLAERQMDEMPAGEETAARQAPKRDTAEAAGERAADEKEQPSDEKEQMDDDALLSEYAKELPLFRRMKKLAQLLREKRRARGSLDFDFPECKITVDELGQPLAIEAYARNSATDLIEDFMLLANETVAEEFFWRELPFVYRSHETPRAEQIEKLSALIRNFGYVLRGDLHELHPKELQQLLLKIADTPEEALIARLTLRSMQQARYTVECLGHYGLAARYYCHFTSPIRRYPDLQIHRIIKEALHGELSARRLAYYEEKLPEVAEQASKTERRADEAERLVERMKKAAYMEHRLGACFEGVISSIGGWGFTVELPNTVEGRVPVSALRDDYFVFEARAYALFGERTHRGYKLGQRLRVRVVRVDRALHTVEFEPEDVQ